MSAETSDGGGRLHVPVRSLLLAALLALSGLAGCLTPTAESGEPVDAAGVASLPVDPSSLVAPVFDLPVRVAGTGLGGIGGEPSVAVGADGTLYVSAPMIAGECIVGLASCGQGRVWRSLDGGATFTLLNDANGRLTPEDRGNGDTDVAVGGDGSVYMVDLGGGVPFLYSRDGGDTWASKGALNDEETSTDRQWIAADGDMVAVTWAKQDDMEPRGIEYTMSHDRGETWTTPVVLTKTMIQLGPVVLGKGGRDVYVPYVDASSRALHVLASHDHGTNWTDVDTGHAMPSVPQLGLPYVEGRWSPTVIFPVMAVDLSGNVYAAWSEYRDRDDGTVVKMSRSTDGGATWSAAVEVVDRQNAVMPWIVAGEAGRVAVAYYASDLPLEPNKGPHQWRVELASTFGGLEDAPVFAVSALSPGVVHVGSYCPHGGGCFLFKGVYNDRTLLDFFEIALTPDGRVVAVWTEDRNEEGREPLVMFAAQKGGSRFYGEP